MFIPLQQKLGVGKRGLGFEAQLHPSLAMGTSLCLSLLICKMGEGQSPPQGVRWRLNSLNEYPVMWRPSLSTEQSFSIIIAAI